MTTDLSIEVAVQNAASSTGAVLQEAQLILREAEGRQITSKAEYDEVSAALLRIAGKRKAVQAEWVAQASPIKLGLSRIDGFWKPVVFTFTQAEALLKGASMDWQRIENEQAEARAEHAAEQKRLADEAAKAKAEGDASRATVLQEMAQDVPLATPAPVERAAGTSIRQTWKARVTDKMALVRAVNMGQVSPTVLEVNVPYLNQLARENHDALAVPGVEFYMEESMAVRS